MNPTRILVLLLLLTSPLVRGADMPGHDVHLVEQQELTLQSVIATAMINLPDYLAVAVREDQAANIRKFANNWSAGPAQLYTNYYDDRWLDDRGEQEFEIGIQFPLLRFGQRDSRQQLATGYEQSSIAFQDLLQLQVAGDLRQQLHQLHQAKKGLEYAEAQADRVEQLVTATRELHDAGNLPEMSLLQAQSLLMQKRRQVLEAEAELVDAERAYGIYTGLITYPTLPITETLIDQEEVGDSHPLLLYLEQEVQVAKATVENQIAQSIGAPMLGVGTREVRGDAFQPRNSTVALSLSVPIGGKSYANANVSVTAARRVATDREIALRNTRRELSRQLHEAEHELGVTRLAMELASSNLDMARRQWQMATAAFEAGEYDFTEVILALNTFSDAEWEALQLQMREQQLISEYNQVMGVIP